MRAGERRFALEQARVMRPARSRAAASAPRRSAADIGKAHEAGDMREPIRAISAACASARPRSSAGGVRACAGSDRPSFRSAVGLVATPGRARAALRARPACGCGAAPDCGRPGSAAASGRRTRSRGCRRGPSLMLWPATAIVPCPPCAWIWRLIEWMSSIAAKSRLRRQMNGSMALRNAAPVSRIAGAGARLDHRRALPVLAHAFVIGLRRVGGDRDLRRAGIGPQAQIDAEDIAVAPSSRSAARRGP